jgi:rhodanese-related sulfurtransferase
MTGQPHQGVTQVRPDEVSAGATILDVREDDEWQAGHVEGSIHMPMREVMARRGELQATDDVVVVCRHGVRSYQVTAYLARSGVAAVNLEGGLVAWARAGGPLVTDDGANGQVI